MTVDVSNCDKEPIHIPGYIQPHGALVAIQSNGSLNELLYKSANCKEFLGDSDRIHEILESLDLDRLKSSETQIERKSLLSLKASYTAFGNARGKASERIAVFDFDVIAHKNKAGYLILEFEKSQSTYQANQSLLPSYPEIQETLNQIENSLGLEDLCFRTVQSVKELSGFHRVMIYQFDSNWNGKVITEAKDPHQEAFLGLQYPASDIPAPARELYKRNWLRLIPNVNYSPVEILKKDEPNSLPPLDLSFSVLRSVSPMHLQYLKNMKVGASMSVSIMREGELWGLIAFHHDEPRYLPYELRQGLELIGKFFSLQLAAKRKTENIAYKQKLKSIQSRLTLAMRKESHFLGGLIKDASLNLLELVDGASGAAIVYRNQLQLIGKTPAHSQIQALTDWLRKRKPANPFYVTNSLSQEYPPALDFPDSACGLLCLTIPEPELGFVLWFKPEVLQTVNWGGDPKKPMELSHAGTTLNPRRSFSLWKETVRLQSLPFQSEELEVIETLRHNIIEIDLERQVVSTLKSNEELDEFAHVISHDLKEPLRGIRNLAEFLESDAGTRLDESEHSNLREIKSLSEKGTRLISELYEYSKLGRVELAVDQIDLHAILLDVLDRLSSFLKERNASVQIPTKLPQVLCDRIRVGELFSNLITNAVKYNDNSNKRVQIGFEELNLNGGGLTTVFYVADNGIGIEQQNQKRIFQIFERLHGPERYGGGSGSGLAIVKRIIERHSGQIWLKSTANLGSTFYFTLAPGIVPRSYTGIVPKWVR